MQNDFINTLCEINSDRARTPNRFWKKKAPSNTEREFCIDNLLVRIHLIIEMIWWTGLVR